MVGEEVRRVPYLLSKGRFTLSSSSSCSSSSYLSLSPGTENCGECGLDGMELEAARALACISRTVVREGGGRGLNRFKNRSQDRDWETSDQGWDLAHDSEDNKAIRAKVEEETKVQQTSETLPPSSNYSTNSLSFSGRKTRLNLSHLTEAEKEARRVRRVVANRESARQTIRRRQAFRDGLAKKVSDLSLVNQNMKIGPIFHDGMKEWSCCKQRSHDFSLFLAIPGCKTGKHTTEKPITKVVSTNTQKAIPTPVQNKRTDDTAACSRCRQGFFCSDHGSKPGISKPAVPAATKDESSTIAPATIKKIVDINEPQICRNKGCGKTFKEKDNHDNACEYHPGPPVFHDRMRGWKCCDVHVKEFDEFMNIPPCAKGWHNANV